MRDCLIIGAGAVGLSVAYELASAGARVRVIDSGEPGQQTSWAGAGMVPPGSAHPLATPLEKLAELSARLHPQWSEELREATGIDNGYQACGALYLADTAAEAEALALHAEHWHEVGIAARRFSANALATAEPAIAAWDTLACPLVYELPGEAQIRNPRHVCALLAACRQRGVEVEGRRPAVAIVSEGDRVVAVETPQGRLVADQYCLTAGVWTTPLARQAGLALEVSPIRGQIALLSLKERVLRRIVNLGPRYLVPRDDGRVLVGSTQEAVGFDTQTTDEAIAGLVELGGRIVPAFSGAVLEKSWAGLRPATPDGLPYIGRAPRHDNLWVAAGHFRAGLQLSPATGRVLSQAMAGMEPELDLQAFACDRPAPAAVD